MSDPEQVAQNLAALIPSGAAALLDPAQLASTLLGPRLGSLVDLSQPIHVTSHTGSAFVVSMAVKRDAEAKLGRGLVLREEGALVRVTPHPDDAPAGAERFACAFSSAAGPATTRLLCATDEAALERSAAYLAHNVAGEPTEADVRLTLPGRVLREKRGGAAKAIGDAASARLGEGLVEKFLAEIEQVDVSVRFGNPTLELGLDLRLSGRQSMVAQALVSRTTAAGPPRAFYRLPADALLALHTRGALAEDIAPLRKALAESLEETLVADGYRKDLTHDLREKLESLLLTGGPLALGVGVAGGREGAEKALAAFAWGATADQARTEVKARAALVPWVMIAVEEPAEKWATGVREIVRRGREVDKNRRPGSTASSTRDPAGDHVDLRVGTLEPGLKLPKDSLHVEVLIAPRAKGTRPARTGHVFIVPKGSGTWIGYSEDVTAIAARLRLAIDDATESGTLSRSEEARSLAARPALGAGLVSLSGIGLTTVATRTVDDLNRAARSAARTASLGTTASRLLTWTATADPTPGSVRLSLRTEITPQVTSEVMRMLGL